MRVVLFQPEIPQNAGNIARTCAVTNTELIFVRPLGFSLSDRYLKRAGLDYWDQLRFSIIDDFSELEPTGPIYFLSSKATKKYSDITFTSEAILVFGSETSGLPESFHKAYSSQFITIPMRPDARSLNLSNAVAIVLYEALRQTGFAGIENV